MRLRIAASALAVGLLAAGCSGSDQPEKATGESPDSSEEVSTASLAKVCGGKVRLTKAPPYEGGGAHPVTFFRPGIGNADPSHAYAPAPPTYLPTPAWQPVVAPGSASLIQLVGCLDRISESATGIECEFAAGQSAPLYTGSYRFTLRVVRTGEVLIQHTEDSEPTCPGGATVKPSDPKVYSILGPNGFLPLIEPFAFWNGKEPRPKPPR